MKFLVVRCPDCKEWHELSELVPVNGQEDVLGCPKEAHLAGSQAIVQEVSSVKLENLRAEQEIIRKLQKEARDLGIVKT